MALLTQRKLCRINLLQNNMVIKNTAMLFVATVHDDIFKDEYTEVPLLIQQTGAISRSGLGMGNQVTVLLLEASRFSCKLVV